MTTPIALNPHAIAILDRLEPLKARTVPIAVGDGAAPGSHDGAIVAPCAVLHFRPGGEMFSSVGCSNTDATIPFQITCVGITAEQARIVHDAVADLLEGASLTVAGREIFRVRRPRGVLGGPPERDDDVTPPLFYIPAYYSLISASA